MNGGGSCRQTVQIYAAALSGIAAGDNAALDRLRTRGIRRYAGKVIEAGTFVDGIVVCALCAVAVAKGNVCAALHGDDRAFARARQHMAVQAEGNCAAHPYIARYVGL